MRRGIPVVMVMALVLTLVLGAGVYAQVKKDEKSGLDRIEGTIQSINKEKSTLTVRQGGGSSSIWTVAYTAQTKFTYRNEPATIERMKDGERVIVLGKYADNVMTAARIDVRTEK